MRVSGILRPLRRDRPWRGMAVGAGLFALALGARWWLGGLVEGFGPMLLLPAILLAGLFGGIRVGLGVAVACVLVAWTWFFPPYGTFVLRSQEAVTLVTFILTAALELYVIRILNLAINDLSELRRPSDGRLQTQLPLSFGVGGDAAFHCCPEVTLPTALSRPAASGAS